MSDKVVPDLLRQLSCKLAQVLCSLYTLSIALGHQMYQYQQGTNLQVPSSELHALVQSIIHAQPAVDCCFRHDNKPVNQVQFCLAAFNLPTLEIAATSSSILPLRATCIRSKAPNMYLRLHTQSTARAIVRVSTLRSNIANSILKVGQDSRCIHQSSSKPSLHMARM